MLLLLISYQLLSMDPTDLMSTAYLEQVINALQGGRNVIFTKFGDGEFFCMQNTNGANSDGDTYSPWLADGLKKALGMLVKKEALIAR